jgi:general secretion pathway protein B
MSFILDALKKAEAERQRQSGPTLLEVRVSSPRRRLPLWTLILGALLAINMILLLLFALHKPAAPLAAAPSAPPVPVASAAGPAPVASATGPAGALGGAAASAPTASATAAETGAAVGQGASASLQSGAALAAAASAAVAAGAENPADDQPAVDARGAGSAGSSIAADSEPINPVDLPSLAELGADIPDLRLDLHVYAERRADRYALINMHKVHEGDVLPEGPRVLQIFHDGVALSYRGKQFMLRPQ